jgi:hypothetical protein
VGALLCERLSEKADHKDVEFLCGRIFIDIRATLSILPSATMKSLFLQQNFKALQCWANGIKRVAYIRVAGLKMPARQGGHR